MAYNEDGYQITRHICPRNCYDTCGMLAYVRKGRLEKITGDPAHGYTKGKLCSKGQNYIQRVYSPERIRFPLRQIGRGSGRWERITWEQAMEIICEKILNLKDRYHSTLPFCLNKYSGNFGVLHSAVEGMFNSLGPTTQARGSPCWSAGLDAQLYDMGYNRNSDPGEMEKADIIILWGVNPAWTAIHSLPYIYRAQEKGATVIVIDPVYTQTARKADYFIQTKPGEDGALALALAKIIYESGNGDQNFIDHHTLGWPLFRDYLANLNLDYLSAQCGQELGRIQELAAIIGSTRAVFIWAGFGLQRHIHGGQTLRAIDALGAITGCIGFPGGGVHYAHQLTWGFNYNFLKDPGNRYLNINTFAQELNHLQEQPVKMLWVSCRNLLAQDTAGKMLRKELDKLELIVTVEQFLTETACYSDIVLPATTQFEEIDVVPSYWHHWIGLNEQAILSYFEAKSDLEIGQLLAKTLNTYRPGSSSFPIEKSSGSFLDEEFNEKLYALLGISHWSELADGPRQAAVPTTAWSSKTFATPSGKFEFFSAKAQHENIPPFAQYHKGMSPQGKYPYWLITSHAQQGLNSQFQNITKLAKNKKPVVFIHPHTAAAKGVKTGQMVRVYNHLGIITLQAHISADTPPDILVCHQGWLPGSETRLNDLNDGLPTDMGRVSTGSQGVAFYDVFVDFDPV